jgi:hypothetical protein
LTADQSVTRPLPTHRTTQTQNKGAQISMPRVRFEPMTPVFERAKTLHALDRVTTVIGFKRSKQLKIEMRFEAQNVGSSMRHVQ